MRSTCLAIAVLASCIAPAAAAASGPSVHPFARVESGTSPFATDARRFVAYKPSPSSLVVLDDQTGRSGPVDGAADCEPVDGAVGVFLLSCPRAPGYFLLHADSGTISGLPGFGSSWDRFTAFKHIGAVWALADTSTGGGSGGEDDWYVNWHTGARKFAAAEGIDPLVPDAPPDLDSPSLRPLGPEQSVIPFAFAEGALFVRQVRTAHYPREYPLVLFRRGRRFVTLDRCRNGCGSYRLAAGRVSWRRRQVGFGYVLRTRRRVRWTVPGPENAGPGMAQTARHVFFLKIAPTATPATFALNVLWARWPRT